MHFTSYPNYNQPYFCQTHFFFLSNLVNWNKSAFNATWAVSGSHAYVQFLFGLETSAH